MRSSEALVVAAEMLKKADAWNLGLDAVGMAPGPIGTLANLGSAGLDAYRHNWGSAAGDVATAGLNLFGLGGLARGAFKFAPKLVEHAPTLMKWAPRAENLTRWGNNVMQAGEGAAKWMSSKPILRNIPHAFGTGKQFDSAGIVPGINAGQKAMNGLRIGGRNVLRNAPNMGLGMLDKSPAAPGVAPADQFNFGGGSWGPMNPGDIGGGTNPNFSRNWNWQ